MTLTLPRELRRAAFDAPEAVFLRTPDGDITYAGCLGRVQSRAASLVGLGVGREDAVALLMDNGPEQVVTWLALNLVGAIHAPLDPALAEAHLARAAALVRPVAVIADDAHLETAKSMVAGLGSATQVVGTATLVAQERSSEMTLDPSVWTSDVDDLRTATLLFTSGTTGRSKACALSDRYLVRAGQLHAKYLGITDQDVLYCPFPLFHIDAATLTVSAALAARATAALGTRFSASGFWAEVRRTEATVFDFMGATLTILWKREPSESDRDHRVRVAWGVPMPDWQGAFEERFGIPLRQVYGLTDAGVPVYDPLRDGQRRGRAGRVIDEYEVRIDSTRRRAGDPEGVGEILVRGREPGLVMNEYFRDPVATERTLVDGWVRTGDLGSLDDDGFLTFHGRLSDSIRRRGENLSAFEVEEIVTSHPLVLEAAAIGVPSDLTEEDVMAVVVLRDDARLHPEELRRHCLEQGPASMAPRYVRFVRSLPRTPTEKVEKHRLREEGVTFDTWDAEQAVEA